MKYSTIYEKVYKQTEENIHTYIHTYNHLLFHIEVSNIQQHLQISRTKELAVTYSSEHHQNAISKSKKPHFCHLQLQSTLMGWKHQQTT